MSDSPPPIVSKADVEIDLSSSNANKISAEESDLFFSTISDPTEKVSLFFRLQKKN